MAHLAYFDESGDSGLVNSPTRFFVLSCVLVPEGQWLSSLDEIVTLRRWLRQKRNIPSRPEIKATDIRKGRGVFLPLRFSLSRRMRLYQSLMRFQNRRLPGLRAFAIAINKSEAAKAGREPREAAWTFAMQRVDRFCQAADSRAILFPDEGHAFFIRKRLRRMRRFHTVPGLYGGTLQIPTQRLLEDPNDRRSHDSYFIQLADWNAFAAHRSMYVDPLPGVPTTLWDELGPQRLLEVNRNTGGPPGIVVWPRT